MGLISAPEKLCSEHDFSEFACGEAALDQWLRQRALNNDANGASRTYVVYSEGRVVGYYALSVGALAHTNAPGRIKRNMPDPLPVMLLARLAVDQQFQGHGIGAGLLRDAVRRTLRAADIAGIRAILVHSISEVAARFYKTYGFVASPLDPLVLMISVSDASNISTVAPSPKGKRQGT